MFDFNPQTPQFGYGGTDSQHQPTNPFIASNSVFGGQGFLNADELDDSMGPDWRKGRNHFSRFGQQTAPVNNNPLGPMASVNSNLFWGRQQANTNPFIFY